MTLSQLLLLLLLLVLCLASVALGISNPFRRANDQNGRCTYTFTVPSQSEESCPDPGQTMSALRALQKEHATYRLELNSVQSRLSHLENLKSQLDRIRAPAAAVPAVPAMGELQREVEILRREKAQQQRAAHRLEETLSNLQREKAALEEEKRRLQQANSALVQTQESRQREMAELRQKQCPQVSEASVQDARLEPRQASRWEADSMVYQELKSEQTGIPTARHIQGIPSFLNSSSSREAATTGCGELVWVGDPMTFRKAENIAGKYGVWMRDPEPVLPYTHETIWRINAVGNDIRQVFEYDNLDDFRKGYPSKVHVLPQPIESTGAVIFKGFLYFQKRKSRILAKYNLVMENLTLQKELPNAGYHGQFPYSWGGYTDIDLAIDETGLWAVYSTDETRGLIVLSKLDPDTLEVQQTWETAIRKQSVANSFMICGTLYTVSSYSAPDTVVNFAYDTSTRKSRELGVAFKNRYRYNSMIDYNPTMKKIFAWDNFNMVMYDVQLSTMSEARGET
ncbi:myocilin isoform X1 [Microcaecilia unicolor]|uniref:Myocilin n=1 Tax=Microcaecilia unicolor TaxID=1415580 RepID=A0A6P7YC97_9AMPH|nr:myocilin isoform X1 [Microcaecilia unicolor]